jgi:hypothetical protein
MSLRCGGFHPPHIAGACAMDCAGLSVQLLPRAWRAHHSGSRRLGHISNHRCFKAEALSVRNAIDRLPRMWRMRCLRGGVDIFEPWAIRYTQHQYDPSALECSGAEAGFLRRRVHRAKTSPARAAMDSRCRKCPALVRADGPHAPSHQHRSLRPTAQRRANRANARPSRRTPGTSTARARAR